MDAQRYSLLALQKRYRVDLDELMSWLDALNVPVYPSADGNERHAAVDELDVSVLDALARHIYAGGTLETFSGAMLPEVLPPQDMSAVQNDALALPRQSSVPALRALVPSDRPYDSEPRPTAVAVGQLRERFEFLDDCAARLWLLTTEQVVGITELKSTTLMSRARETGSVQWHSWTFARAGRQGREALWKVSTPRITASVAIEVAGTRPSSHPGARRDN